MSADASRDHRNPIVLRAGEGRSYPMGRIRPHAFVLIPGGTAHDFENRGTVRAGFLNFSVPGDFENQMEGVAEWFIANR